MSAQTHNLNEADYRRLDAANWSSIKEIEVSPKHYLSALTREWDDSTFMRKGRAAHCLALEPQHFERDFKVWDQGRRAGKVWEEFKLEHGRKDIINEKEYEGGRQMGDAVRAHPVARKLIDSATMIEQPITWTDPKTGILCKGKPDLVTDEYLVDLKTSYEIGVAKFTKTIGYSRYYAQAAFYERGMRELDGKHRSLVIIAAESAAPFDVGVIQIQRIHQDMGWRHCQMLLGRLKECTTTNRWPGQYPEDGMLEAEIPDFALDSPMDELDYEGIEVVA